MLDEQFRESLGVDCVVSFMADQIVAGIFDCVDDEIFSRSHSVSVGQFLECLSRLARESNLGNAVFTFDGLDGMRSAAGKHNHQQNGF